MRLTAAESWPLLRSARVARLATSDISGAPHLVPVTFAVTDPADQQSIPIIVFAVDHKPKSTTALRRLDNIAANPQVCWLVDHYDDDWEQLWWVRIDARAAILDGDIRTRAIAALRAKYPQYQEVPPAGVVVGSSVSRVTGWRASPNRRLTGSGSS